MRFSIYNERFLLEQLEDTTHWIKRNNQIRRPLRLVVVRVFIPVNADVAFNQFSTCFLQIE